MYVCNVTMYVHVCMYVIMYVRMYIIMYVYMSILKSVCTCMCVCLYLHKVIISSYINRYNEVISQIADEYYPDNLLLVTHQYGVEQALLLALDKKEAMNYEVKIQGNIHVTVHVTIHVT